MEEQDKGQVISFLEGIENGNKQMADIYNLTQSFDPLLTYFMLRYLREKHPVTEASSGAGSRLLDLMKTYPGLGQLAVAPKNEPMIEWFDDTHNTQSYFKDPSLYVDLIVDKLEG